MVALEWPNATYVAVNIHDAHDDRWWSIFTSVLSRVPPFDSMVALEWLNVTYAAINVNAPHDDRWWSIFKAMLAAPLIACYDSGVCYGYAGLVNGTVPWEV